MTQATWTTLDPDVHGGAFLSTALNNQVAALHSNHRGASRPSYAVAGMIWPKVVSATDEKLYFFDGNDDIEIGTVNPTANTFTPAGGGGGGEAPTGSVMMFAGSSAPSGWLLCYGQAVSRTTYANLFSAIGTTYGVGDGSTTFNLPDLRGRTIAGLDNMGGSAAGRLTGNVMNPDGNTLGGVGGSERITITDAQSPSHNHSYSGVTVKKGVSGTGGAYGGVINATQGGFTTASTVTMSTNGGDDPHSNTQPTMLMNSIIKT